MRKKPKPYPLVLSKTKDLRFEELEKVILDCGYYLHPSSGSNAVYRKQDSVTLTIPRKTPVKSYLIDQILNAIGDCLEYHIE